MNQNSPSKDTAGTAVTLRAETTLHIEIGLIIALLILIIGCATVITFNANPIWQTLEGQFYDAFKLVFGALMGTLATRGDRPRVSN